MHENTKQYKLKTTSLYIEVRILSRQNEKKKTLDWKNLHQLCRETGVSWHIGGPIQDPRKLFNTIIVLRCTWGFRRALNLSSMMPKDACLSNNYTGWLQTFGKKSKNISRTIQEHSKNFSRTKFQENNRISNNCLHFFILTKCQINKYKFSNNYVYNVFNLSGAK